MKICITGALGHIGSALIRDLRINHNLEKVYLIDNLLTQRYASLFDLPGGTPFQFYPMDVTDSEMEKVIQDSDLLIHLSAITEAEASLYKPEVLEQHNKTALKHVAELCAQHQTKLFFPSSTSVYSLRGGLAKEDATGDDLVPQTPYAESKRYGEDLLTNLGKKQGLKYAIFRWGTMFGWSIGMRFHTAVNKFTWQACLGKEITVWKTALHQQRPYCDLVDAIASLNHLINNDLFQSQLYNVATCTLTVQDVLDTLKGFIPNLKVKLIDSPIMNDYTYGADIEKYQQTGFKYHGSLKTRTQETIAKLKNINVEIKKNL